MLYTWIPVNRQYRIQHWNKETKSVIYVYFIIKEGDQNSITMFAWFNGKFIRKYTKKERNVKWIVVYVFHVLYIQKFSLLLLQTSIRVYCTFSAYSPILLRVLCHKLGQNFPLNTLRKTPSISANVKIKLTLIIQIILG